MSWTSSFFIAALTGVLGLVVAGLVTAACSEWLNVSNREGAAGYLMVALALLGGAVAFALGLVVSRVLAAQPDPGFLKALGISCGAVVAVGALALGLGWLKADFAPKIDGQSLALAIEVRCPKGFILPKKADEYGFHASVRVPGSGRYQQQGELDLKHAKKEDGRWLVTAVVPLHTSSSNKVMDVRFSKEHSLTFWLPLRSKPNRADLEWSKWIDSGWDVGTAEPPPEKKFNLRYKVQLVEPPPPAEDPAVRAAAEEQARFDALGAESPIQAWFPFTQYGATDARWAVVVGHVTARPNYVAELAALLVATEDEIATGALSLIPRLPSPQPDLLAPMATAGRHIAELIQKFNATTPEQDPNQRGADSVAARFGAWSEAARALREKSGGDFTTELGEILKLSRVRTDSDAMRGSVRRIASYWMKQWANVDPLPGDPPPR
jgi:hypothetical protein